MYQVLARKYRPRNFYELVGQQHVSKALSSALQRDRLHHAYLFTGTRGVGKTTIARILAKCLNCEIGVTATPCEQCNVCQAVNEGRFIDLIEIDAASRTKVEDTRELLDNVPYAPTQGRYKVYLIDEVHMLSTHSFNALLKTLEEPPAHVKFLFATTDPQKLPITVISRCLQFTLRPLTIEELHHHLQQVLTKEEISYDDSSLWQLAESAQGSVRDSLSLTDQAIAYGQGKIQYDDVKEMLGLIDKHLVYDLLMAIHTNQREYVAQLLLKFREQSIDVSMVLDQFISVLHDLALTQHLPALSLKYNDETNQKIKKLAQSISAQDLQLYYQIACKGREDLQIAVSPMQGFEMCILRLLAFRPLADNEQVAVQQVPQVTIEQPLAISSNTPVENRVSEDVLSSGFLHQDSQEATEIESKSVDGLVHFQVEKGLIEVLPHTMQSSQPIVSQEAILHFDNTKDSLFDRNDNLVGIESTQAIESVNVALKQVVEQVQDEQITDDLSASPQQILQLQSQTLDGSWDAEKWAYWLEQSSLSPAIKGFLQDSVMAGSMDQPTLFVLQQHQNQFGQFEQTIQQQIGLLNNGVGCKFAYVKGFAPEMTTPLQLLHHRQQRAYQRANDLLLQDNDVQALMKQFTAEIIDIRLDVEPRE